MRRPAVRAEGSKFKEKVRIKAYRAQEYAGVVWPTWAPTPPRSSLAGTCWSGKATRNGSRTTSPATGSSVRRTRSTRSTSVAAPLLRRLDDEPRQAARGTRRLERRHRREGPRAQEDRLRHHGLRRHQAQARRRRDRGGRVLAHRPPGALPQHPPRRPRHAVPHPRRRHPHAARLHDVPPLRSGEEPQAEVPFTEMPVFDDNGKIRYDYVLAQDQLAWIIQGPISDRTTGAPRRHRRRRHHVPAAAGRAGPAWWRRAASP